MKPHVVDVTQDDFESVALQGSQQTPVLVDFGRIGVRRANNSPVLESWPKSTKAFLLAKATPKPTKCFRPGWRSQPANGIAG